MVNRRLICMSRDCVHAEDRPTSTHTAARRGRETTPTSSGDVPSFDTLPVLPVPMVCGAKYTSLHRCYGAGGTEARSGIGSRQTEIKGRAFARGRFGPHASTMALNDAFHDGKS